MDLELLVINECKEKGLNATFETLKKEVEQYTCKYNDIVFGDEQIKEAKKLKASLNATRDTIDKQRKLVKQEYLKPLEAFESKVKDITILLDKPIIQIGSQITAFENKVKEAKKQEISNYFNENNKDLKDLVKIGNVWNEKFLNATFSLKEAKEEIDNKLITIKSGLETIDNAIQSDFKTEIKTLFIETGDLANALKRGQYLKEKKEMMDKIKAEQDKIKAEQEAIKGQQQQEQDKIKAEQDAQDAGFYELLIKFGKNKPLCDKFVKFCKDSGLIFEVSRFNKY